MVLQTLKIRNSLCSRGKHKRNQIYGLFDDLKGQIPSLFLKGRKNGEFIIFDEGKSLMSFGKYKVLISLVETEIILTGR